jgi:fermentation-respiration switch protein FrsA (DUF1100 family)
MSLFYLTVPIVLNTEFYQKVILMPFPASEQAYSEADRITGKKHEDCFFTNVNHDRLHAFLWRVPGAKKIVIYHHGNAGNIANRAPAAAALLALGANVFAYDYRGYGKSTGDPTLRGLLDDGVAAYDYVRNELKFAPENIVNYGESIGAGVACDTTGKRQTGGLILQSGIPSLPIVGRDHFFFLKPYPDFFFPSPHMDNVALVHDIHCPMVVINGAKDTTVTVEMARLIYNNANEPKQLFVLKDSGHNSILSGDDLRKYIKAVRTVIGDTTSGAH